jgi:hypothetical protein
MSDVVLKFKKECGCLMGKYFTVIGIFCFAAFVIYFGTYIHLGIFKNILILFYFLLCFSIIGKAVGLVKSYLSFKKSLSHKNGAGVA